MQEEDIMSRFRWRRGSQTCPLLLMGDSEVNSAQLSGFKLLFTVDFKMNLFLGGKQGGFRDGWVVCFSGVFGWWDWLFSLFSLCFSVMVHFVHYVCMFLCPPLGLLIHSCNLPIEKKLSSHH